MLIQQTVYPHTEEILIETAKATFFLKFRKKLQIIVVLLFLHNHTDSYTTELCCCFFYVFNFFPPLLDLLESTPCFCFFLKGHSACGFITFEQGHYLRRLRSLRHFDITGLDVLELTSSSSPTLNYCCKCPPSFPPCPLPKR